MTTPSRFIFAVTLALGACQSPPRELSEGHPDAPGLRREPRRGETHRIVESDHRKVLPMQRDDRIVLPNDPAFDWRVEFEDPSGFARVTGVDAGGEAYRLVKSGPFRMMVFGEPKCLTGDAACGKSRRRWDVTVTVP